MDRKKIIWVILMLLGILLFTRFYNLTDRPLHHDEGVNGYFMNNLFYNGYYQYNPQNYHGPFFYFINLPAFAVFGSTILGLRITAAIFGCLIFFLLLTLKKKYSAVGFLAILSFFVLSPSITYYSRYAIHEIFFVFFTLCFYISLTFFIEKKNSDYLYLSAACLGFLFTIKETAYIVAFIFFIYFIFAEIFLYKKEKKFFYFRLIKENSKNFLFALLIFVSIIFIFYSNFFHNLKGVFDIIVSLYYWINAGTTGHVKSFFYFINLLIYYELPIFVFGIIGVFYSVKNKKNLLLVWWALSILLIYSLIPYKTPWLLPNMVLPFILLAGYGIAVFCKNKKLSNKFFLILILISVFYLSYHLISVNFIHPSEDYKNSFAYAHTTEDIKWVFEKIEVSGYKKVAMIGEYRESYWPLPFYLQNYKIIYGNSTSVNVSDEDILIMYQQFTNQFSDEDLMKYKEYNFQLRPNIWTKLYIRKFDNNLSN